MRSTLFLSLVLASSLTGVSQTTSQSTPQASAASARQKAIDETNTSLADTLSKLNHLLGQAQALDASDAKLKMSDEDQIDTSHMIDNALYKIDTEEAPQLQERANQWDVKRQ